MDHLEIYRRMLVIRRFEEKMGSLFSQGKVGGTTHLCIGQEACAVGAAAAVRPDDPFVSTHRGHGHFLAKGAEPYRLFAELMGKADGYCRGKGGSQHVSFPPIGFLGTNGITGGGIPLAAGAALSAKLLRTGRVVVSFFGDGAVNQGTFHETLNMAAVWSLPVIFFCENNLYAQWTHIARTTAVLDIAARAAAYRMPGHAVDGMDPQAVCRVVSEAAARARDNKGPTLIEAKTYRYAGHSKSDVNRSYRTREEEEEWLARDPLILTRQRLLSESVLESDLAALESQVEKEIAAAAELALKAPVLPAEEAAGGVYRP